MQKAFLTVLVLATLAVGLVATQAEEEKPWFDLKNCAFCKEIDAQPGLADHMKHQYFNVESGIMCVSHIDKEYLPAFEKAQAGMGKVVEAIKAGQIPPMCQHCMKIGEFTAAGVKMEQFQPDFGFVMLWTSPDTAMVSNLHAFGDRNNAEMAKWLGEQTQKTGN